MSFKKILKDIKDLKIQGATNIAIAAANALKEAIKESKKTSNKQLLQDIENAKNMLFKTRPTEPMLRNTLLYILDSLEDLREENIVVITAHVFEKIKQALKFIEEGEKKIVEIGAQKIKNDMIIFTHCHSSNVVEILKTAKKQGKKFEVHNTETRPKFQGRITATELSNEGIKVTHYVDSAARLALKKADIMLIGADAITCEGKVINKIGSELFAEVAHKYEIPVYVCSHSWKFDPQTIFGKDEPIEKRSSDEVWKEKPKKVKIENFAFEQVSPELITGIITELGIHNPETLIEELEKKYKFMFKD